MRQIKFRAWDNQKKKMILDVGVFDNMAVLEPQYVYDSPERQIVELKGSILMQFTGLLDKNGLQEVYEGDIIDEYGNIKGNAYEMDKGENDLLIQGFGTSAWSETEKKGLERGLKYS